jgi:hypothetical protein
VNEEALAHCETVAPKTNKQNSISSQESSSLLAIGCNIYIYIALESRWCNIIVLNVHAPNVEKSADSKEFYEDLQQFFFHHFLSTI